MNDKLKIRDAQLEDAERLVEIYSYYVLNTAVSFEYKVPTVEEFKERIRNTKKKKSEKRLYSRNVKQGISFQAGSSLSMMKKLHCFLKNRSR